jgi:hypothetical protein
VKIETRPEGMDWYEGLRMVTAEIASIPGRELKSVVQTSRSMGYNWVADDLKKFDVYDDQLYNKPIRDLFNLGVPLIVASGNKADKGQGALLIDTFPGILKTPDLPIINVGAVGRARERIPFSQYGPLVDVYALGANLKAQTKVNKVEAPHIDGTSFGESYWTQYRCNMF